MGDPFQGRPFFFINPTRCMLYPTAQVQGCRRPDRGKHAALANSDFLIILHDYCWFLAIKVHFYKHNPGPSMATRRKHLILTAPVREGKPVKVRLDSRTIVMVKNAKALAFWKERYPKAEVIKE